MRWMVGIDIRNTSAGAVAMGRSLARRSKTHELVAAHVIEDHARAALAAHDPKAAVELPMHVEAMLEPLSEDKAFADVGSIPASAAEDGLEVAANERGCHGFILGRHAPAQGAALIRLGRVARRTLRALSRPVMIVPPDMAVDEFSVGPVFLATDLRAETCGAARMARLLARSLDTDMLVTTVVSAPDEIQHYLPRELWGTTLETETENRRRTLAQWVEANVLEDARTSVVSGALGPKLLEVAKVSGASLIVVGSRRLTTLERIFVSSTGSFLAGHAPIPVVVVPPGWTPPD